MRVTQCAPVFDAETRARVAGVLHSGWLTEGAECEAFTHELLEYMHAPYGSLVSNGTVALMLALWAIDLSSWDGEVITPTLTFAATANAVIAAGGRPDLFDYHGPPGKWLPLYSQYDPPALPVWLFGNRPTRFLDTTRLTPIVEDAAQALGCWVDGKHAGLFGDVGCFSFYADKTLTTGEGGFIVTKSRDVWERVEMLRNHGRPYKSRGYNHEAFGINARMTDMQAAIGRVQLRHLDEWIATKRQHWQHYADALAGIDNVTWLPLDDGCVPFRFVLYVPDPVALAEHLEAHEVQTRRMFVPLHRQPFLSRYAHGNYPQADWQYEHGLLLPCHQYLTESDVAYVCEQVRAFYDR